MQKPLARAGIPVSHYMAWRFRKIAVGSVLSALFATAAVSRADLPAARMTSVFPPGAQRGTFVEVTVAGADLDDLVELRFSHPGLTAKPATDPAGKPLPNKFVVAAWPDVPAGVYEVRAVGRFGVSNPRAFSVGESPELNEPPSNSSPGGATEVPVGAVVNGQCNNTGVDHFRFAAKRGQRLFIDCTAAGIDSRLVPVVTLTDAAGRELDRSRSGDVIDFTPPLDGACLVQVHDVLYRGGPEFFYRLSISTGPRIDFIMPPAGQAGTKAKFVVYGRNLPGGTPVEGVALDGRRLEQLPAEIELPVPGRACILLASPAQTILNGFAHRVRADKLVSNPSLVALSDAPPVPEQPANDKPAEAQKLALPCEVAGQFFPRGDRDWFTFDGKKGEAYWIEVFCQRLGLPADPFLLVQRVTKNEKGEDQAADVKEVYDTDAPGGPDFAAGSRDPSFRLEVKEDGTYRVQVRDLFNTLRDDPRLAYRLSVRRDNPDFHLVAMPLKSAPADLPGPPLLRKGGSVPVRVIALRRDGFGGDIQVAAEGLPPGVTCPPATISGGGNAAVLVFTASDGAAGWSGNVKIIGKAQLGGTEAVREARGAAVLWPVSDPNAEAVRTRLVSDAFPIAISAGEIAPLTIDPADARPLEASAGTKVKLPLKLKARTGPAGKLKLKIGGHPLLDPMKEVEVDGNKADAAPELDLNQHKLPPGTHTLYVRAEGPVKYLRNPDAAKAAEEAKQRAEKTAAETAAAAKQAAEKLAAAKGGTDVEATKAAEKAAAEADAKSKEAEKQKQEATKAAAAAGPKDTPAVLYSSAIVLKVNPAK